VFHVKQGHGQAEQATSPDVQEKIERFLDLLMLWNGRINLIAERDRLVIHQRHVEDSLQLAPLLADTAGPHLDLGSGGGFPGLVLAFVTTRPTHLVEADRRKAAFLVEVSARLNLRHVTVHACRIDRLTLQPVTAITARALAPLRGLLPHVERFLQPEGVAVFPKGQAVEMELAEARQGWTFQDERFTSRTDPSATILRLSKVRRAGQA
jgi:16S rRNA (guanine527-N7)-methyltransferase